LGQGTFAAQSPITCPNRQLFRTLDEIGAKMNFSKKIVLTIEKMNDNIKPRYKNEF